MLFFQGISEQLPQGAELTTQQQACPLLEVAVCCWRVGPNSVTYERQQGHTLSLYLQGGHKSYRVGQNANKGSPGKLCLMPKGINSNWYVNEQLDLAHLYFSDELLRQYAARFADMDSRLVALDELTYQQDPHLEALFKAYLQYLRHGQQSFDLAGEQLLHACFSHLLQHYNLKPAKLTPIKAGLSPYHRQKIRDYIQQNLGQKLTISAMASQLDLSPYHFAHMFKLSFADTPANYVLSSRIQQARLLLQTPMSLAEIATTTGFNQQSHLSQYFKRLVGCSPGKYRQLLCN